MRAVLYRRTAAAIEMASLFGTFLLLLFCLLLPWRPLGQYGGRSYPMAAPSGFWSSPEHASLGNLLCIAPADPHGHQNGLVAIVNFVIDSNLSQRPCYGPLKLKLRHSDIYNNVISLLLCFGHLPTMMDTISATIVAGRRAQIILNIEVDRNKLISTLI